MRQLLLLISMIVFFLITSCDAPRDRRSAYRDGSQDTNSNAFSHPPDGDGEAVVKTDTEIEIIRGTDTVTVPEEAKHCNFSQDGNSGYSSSHNHIGSYTVCQSTSDQETVYVQVKGPITDSQLCVIPTFDNNGSSVYIGEARCFSVSSATTIQPVKLERNRPGYEGFNISSVIITKDKAYFYPPPFNRYILSPDAFLFCSNYLAQYGDPSYCQAFVSLGQYVYHKF